MKMINAVAPLAFASLSFASLASAQQATGSNSAPQAVPLPAELPAPRDVAYPGTISLAIDATDTRRGVYGVVETIPVASGTRELTLLEPLWVPGGHSSTLR